MNSVYYKVLSPGYYPCFLIFSFLFYIHVLKLVTHVICILILFFKKIITYERNFCRALSLLVSTIYTRLTTEIMHTVKTLQILNMDTN